MNKTIIAIALALASFSASAAEPNVSVGYVYDFKQSAPGIRIALTTRTVDLATTIVDNQYTRLSVGKTVEVFSMNKLTLNFGVQGVYQNTMYQVVNGYGASFGANVAYKYTDKLSVNIGIEQFVAQDRLSAFEGTSGIIGVSLKY